MHKEDKKTIREFLCDSHRNGHVIETDKLQIKKNVSVFADELVKRLGDQICEIIWYGSTARGDAEDGSDIDVAVICQYDDSPSEDRIWSIAHEISLEYNVLIDARVISQERFYGDWGRLSYLAEDIQNEGIVIWKTLQKTLRRHYGFWT